MTSGETQSFRSGIFITLAVVGLVALIWFTVDYLHESDESHFKTMGCSSTYKWYIEDQSKEMIKFPDTLHAMEWYDRHCTPELDRLKEIAKENRQKINDLHEKIDQLNEKADKIKKTLNKIKEAS